MVPSSFASSTQHQPSPSSTTTLTTSTPFQHPNQQKQLQRQQTMYIPHRGSLCRVHINNDIDNPLSNHNNHVNNTDSTIESTSILYTINIITTINNDKTTLTSTKLTTINTTNKNHHTQKCQYQLKYQPYQYKYLLDLFTILDVNNDNYLSKEQVYDFIFTKQRCGNVLKKRDALLQLFCTANKSGNNSGTKSSDDNYEVDEDTNNNHHHHDVGYLLETQDQQEIYNCILGENFQSADDIFYDDEFDDDHDDTDNNNNDDNDLSSEQEGLGLTLNVDNDEMKDNFNSSSSPSTCPIVKNTNAENFANSNDNIFEMNNRHLGDDNKNKNDSVNNKNIDNNVQQTNNMKQTITDSTCSETFAEIWNAVIQCSVDYHNDPETWQHLVTKNYNQQPPSQQSHDHQCPIYLGIEGWMVLCRFIALAQYQDAKRWFSSQGPSSSTTSGSTNALKQSPQSKVHNHSSPPRSNDINSSSSDSNEVVLVDVPTPERPLPILGQYLVEYELMTLQSDNGNDSIPLPEFYLDHNHLFLHDYNNAENQFNRKQSVKVALFGNNHTPTASDKLEFVIEVKPEDAAENASSNGYHNDNIIVRRSFTDLSWLHETFRSQKKLGGSLCGHIIPPFPSSSMHSNSSHHKEDSMLHTISGGSSSNSSSTTAMVASASRVMVTSATKTAKRLLGHFSLPSSLSSSVSSSSNKSKNSTKTSTTMPLTTKKDRVSSSSLMQKGKSNIRTSKYSSWKGNILDNPISKTKHLERYLNYLLEHRSMSSSFPLHVMLEASQHGVESAKHIIQGKKQSKRDLIYTMICSGSATEVKQKLEKYCLSGDLSWVRSAAQAALAVKLHGVLETTGYQSASAKLQHASLPKFSNLRTLPREDSDGKKEEKVLDSAVDFEEGIVCVESNLDDETHFGDNVRGYDLLPAPLPLSKRSPLCAGSAVPANSTTKKMPPSQQSYGSGTLINKSGELGVMYGDTSPGDVSDEVALGDISVERDIERLRDMILVVDKSLGRCLASGLCVGAETCDKMGVQLDLLKGVGDGWLGSMISQKSLLKGVDLLECIRDGSISTTHSFIIDLSWNASLASSAVAAADEVHEAIAASRTASRAKLAAEMAARNAHKLCQTEPFSSAEEAKQAQTRASDLRGQAIHAAVVEYEAITAKRLATMALASDVKGWNVHRKKQLMTTCFEFVKNQRKTAQESLAAWEGLRYDLLQSSSIASIVNSSVKNHDVAKSQNPDIQSQLYQSSRSHGNVTENGEIEESFSPNQNKYFSISYSNKCEECLEQSCFDYVPEISSSIINDFETETKGQSEFEAISHEDASSSSQDVESTSFHDTFEENFSLDNESNEETAYVTEEDSEIKNCPSDLNIETDESVINCKADNVESSLEMHNICAQKNAFNPGNSSKYDHNNESSCHMPINIEEGVVSLPQMDTKDVKTSTEMEDGGMSSSMQSLVDGLMNWGGQWDEEEDHTALIDGIASSILEEDGMFNLQ